MRRPTASATLSVPRVIAGAGVLGLLVLTLSGNSATRFFDWPWFGLGQALLLLPVAWLCVQAARSKELCRLGTFAEAGIVGILLACIASSLRSSTPWTSANMAGFYLAGIALFVLLYSWLRRNAEGINLAARIVGIISAAVVFKSLISWILSDGIHAWSVGALLRINRNAHPFGHSNYTAGFAVLTLPWLVLLALTRRGRSRLVWSIISVSELLVLFSTGSRGGVIALLAVAVATALFMAVAGMLSRRQMAIALVTVFLIVAAAVATNPRLRGFVTRGEWDSLSSESNRQRQAMMQAGLLMIQHRPLFGYGAGAVPLVYPEFRAELSGGVETVLQLHNTYLQLGAELGCAGLASVLLVICSAAGGIRRLNSLQLTGVAASRLPLAAPASLFAYAVFAFTDFQFDVPVFVALVAFDLAVVMSVRPESSPQPETLNAAAQMASAVVSASALIAMFLVSWPNARARLVSAQAFSALDRADSSRFIELSLRASDIARDDPAYLNQAAAYLIDLRAACTNSEDQARLTTQIIDLLDRSLALQPVQEFAHFNLGWISLEAGRQDALEHFRAAARLVPDKGGIYLGMALARLSRNDPGGAAAALAIECLNDPMFLTAPWWSTPGFQELKPAVASRLRDIFRELGPRLSAQPSLAREVAYCSALTAAWAGQPNVELGNASNTGQRRAYFNSHRGLEELTSSSAMRYRRERTGYPVLSRHPRMPPPHDAYVVLENATAAQSLRYLFPPKGWLPTYMTVELARALAPN